MLYSRGPALLVNNVEPGKQIYFRSVLLQRIA
jgi:hypothetical protein